MFWLWGAALLEDSVGRSEAEAVGAQAVGGEPSAGCGGPELVFIIDGADGDFAGEAIVEASAGGIGEVASVAVAVGEFEFSGTHQEFDVRDEFSVVAGIAGPDEVIVFVAAELLVEAQPSGFSLDAEVELAENIPVDKDARATEPVGGEVGDEIGIETADGERWETSLDRRGSLSP